MTTPIQTNQETRTCQTRLQLPSRGGLNGREAAMLVKLERSFQAELVLECCGKQATAKSIMGLLCLEGDDGHTLTATATGPDAEEMIRAVEHMFAEGFRGNTEIPEASFFRRKFALHFNLVQ